MDAHATQTLRTTSRVSKLCRRGPARALALVALIALLALSAVVPVAAAAPRASGVDSDPATISGQVTVAATHNALSGINVVAWSHTGAIWMPVTSATSDAFGKYTLNVLVAGTYVVGFNVESSISPDWVPQFYAGALHRALGTPIVLTDGEDRTGIDAALYPYCRLKGTVTAAATGLPVSGEGVEALLEGGGSVGATTNGSGEYEIGQLEPGTYAVYFASFGSLAFQFWNTQLTFGSATPVVLGPGEVRTGIDAALLPAAHIRGTVTDVATGLPVSGIGVHADCYQGLPHTWWEPNLAFTNADGFYDIDGLAAGQYRPRFTDGTHTYIFEYWKYVLDAASATDVFLAQGETVNGIDGLMTTVAYTVTPSAGPGGTIKPDAPMAYVPTREANVSITPDAGYHVSDVVVDGTSVGPRRSYAFPNISANHTISAAFEADPTETVTAPTAAASWQTNTAQTVSWNLDHAVSVGEFRVWLVSSGGSWYVNQQVLPVAGRTTYNASVTVPATLPPGAGYRAYVYWRPTVGSGAWVATARGAAFSIVPGPPVITVTAPLATSSWPSGSSQNVSWRLSNAAPGGEFRVWLVTGTSWYVNRQVLPVGGTTTYSTSVGVACPAGTGYQAYVYWRPTVGSGSWVSTARSAAFTVTPVNITSPTAASSWAIGSTQTVTWTINPTVSVGEFRVWLVTGGSWYIGRTVAAVVAQPTYNLSITVSGTGMTAGTYRPYVYYRSTVGSGSWTVQTIGAAFTVTSP